MPGPMQVSDFDFDLPDELVAQEPPAERGASRLMRLDRVTGVTTLGMVADLARWLRPDDLLVVNDTRVFPARLLGRRLPGGGRIECLLIRALDETATEWEALVHPGARVRPGTTFVCDDLEGRLAIEGEVRDRGGPGRRIVRLRAPADADVTAAIERAGHMPLPPYIKRPDRAADRERYQTVFSRTRGSVAAPTAGLHFTPALLEAIAARGVTRVSVTHHVGYGTFKPVRADLVEDHTVDAETYAIEPAVAAQLTDALAAGRRIVAVGTTTTRALESAVRAGRGTFAAGRATTDLFLYPGVEFRAVGALVTNFHVPRSSLLFLVSAFAGRERILGAYARAVAERFRFYSYGDAMLIE